MTNTFGDLSALPDYGAMRCCAMMFYYSADCRQVVRFWWIGSVGDLRTECPSTRKQLVQDCPRQPSLRKQHAYHGQCKSSNAQHQIRKTHPPELQLVQPRETLQRLHCFSSFEY